MFRIALVAFVAGTASTHVLPSVPPAWAAAVGGVASCAACAGWLRWARGARRAGHCLLALAVAGWVAGAALALVRIDLRLQDCLAPELENVPLRLDFLVTGLATGTARGQRFDARVLRAPPGVPERVQLAWHGAPAQVVPGQVWRAAAVLKQPHGNLNPHGFDYEAYLFEHGFRATGTLRGQPRLLEDSPAADFGVLVQRMRHASREALRGALGSLRYGPVLVALTIGDQAGVDRHDWDTFGRTGITHLVSISGLHVTMLAALAGGLVLQTWKSCRWRGVRLAERMPAQVTAAAAALLVAWFYCLLAGWGVPARRTFFMLATVAIAAVLRLPLSGSRVLSVAAALVCALDPWAPLAPGFWLSFGAVALLVVAGSGRWRRRREGAARPAWRKRLPEVVREGARAQAVLTIGMLPALALLFHQISLVSPLANALAIPVVSAVVTPLALGALALCMVPGLEGAGTLLAEVAHFAFAWLMEAVQWLGEASFATHAVAAPPWPLAALAIAGALWTLQPRGLPGRGLALALLLPMLLYRPARPEVGGWRLTLLDVGQGSAIVIETHGATLLFDTGPRYGDSADAGSRVIVPYLRARGVRKLDHLIVSHADDDHAGGLASIQDVLPVTRLHASYELAPAARKGAEFSRCAAGQQWTLDGVEFSFLHPQALPDRVPARERNAHSCVLRVRGAHHTALLTGDIAAAQEAVLAGRADLAADVVSAPHHGSRNSSSRALVAAAGAAHVVAQAGYLNRYRHPHPLAIRRWESSGAVFHRTDVHGAVVFVSAASGLRAMRERERRARYWHARPP